MSTIDFDHPPDGVVVLADPDDTEHLGTRAWVQAVRRDVPRQLRHPVAHYLAEAREPGES